MLNKEYENELFIDFLITRNNTKEIILKYKEKIIKSFDYKSILLVYEKLATSKLYSEEQINNFKYVLEFIIQNRIENKEDADENICLNGILEDIVNIEPSYDFYYQEFIEKFNDIDEFINNSYHIIDKKEIESSVQFDYFVYEYLSGVSSLKIDLINFISNPNFILSINKFLYERPTIFSDSSFKARTINSLITLKAYYEKNNIEFDNKKIKKLHYLINEESSPTDIKSIKQYEIILLIHKVIVDNRKIEDTDYKDLIITDYFIENLNVMLLDLKNNNLGRYYGLDIKERLKCVLSYILKNRNDNKTKIKYNEMMYLLEEIEFSKINFFLYDEAEIKYTTFELYKRLFIKLIFGRDISLEEDMKVSIGRDYDTFRLLLSKEELDLKKIDPYCVRSIKKFENDIPEIFDSDIVLEKVDKILNSQKVLRKR